MNLTYIGYLMFYLPLLIFSLWVSKEKVLKDEPIFLRYITGIILLLAVWGEGAIYLKHWYYPNNTNLGIYIGNHPLEAYIQGFITTLFIISIWEFVKKRK